MKKEICSLVRGMNYISIVYKNLQNWMEQILFQYLKLKNIAIWLIH